MANKYLKRKFTLRESILLIILFVVLVLGLYFGLVYYPIASRTADLNQNLDDVQLQLTVAESLKKQYDDMKAELNTMDKTTVMPQYKNNEQQETLRALFETIFSGVTNYRITYNTSEPSDGVRTRTVGFIFTIDASNAGEGQTVYQKVKELLASVMTTGYRCCMQNLSLSPDGGDLEKATQISVNCNVEFYELDS